MTIGVVGRKAGMTRIFTEDGASIPVTVIEVEPNKITQLKADETDGYRAVQVTVGKRKASRVNKAAAGHFAKAGVEAGRGLWESRLDDGEGDGLEVGGERLAVEGAQSRGELRRGQGQGCLSLALHGSDPPRLSKTMVTFFGW